MGLIYRSRWYLLFAQTKYKIMYRYAAKATRTVKKQQQVWLAKKQLCACSTLFCTFLCRCFVRLQRETSRNFLVTRFMEEMSYVFSFTFFSLPLIFTLHWWPLAFLILSPPLQNFHVVLPTKKCLLCFLSLALNLCRPFSRWASLACRLLSLFLCLSLALYSKFVDMTINLSLIL